MGVAGIDCVIVIDRQVIYAEALCSIARKAGLAEEALQFTGVPDVLTSPPRKRALVIAEEAAFGSDPRAVTMLLREALPPCRIVCATGGVTRTRAMELISCGIDGVIGRTQSSLETLDALFAVVRGGVYFAAQDDVVPSGGICEGDSGAVDDEGADHPPADGTGDREFQNRSTVRDTRIMILGARRSAEARAHPARNLASVLTDGVSSPRLSERQKDVFALMARGLSNKGIAQELDLSEATVKVHVQNLFRALRVQSRYQAISRYHSIGVQARAG